MKETERVSFDSMPPIIRGSFLTKEQAEKLKKPFVRCKDCCHWKPPHIRLNDGKQRAYKKGDKEGLFGIGVTADIGLNVGGMCWVDHNCGYGRDMRVHRSKDDYCSRAEKLPDGTTGEEYWGLSEEPTELRDDFDY